MRRAGRPVAAAAAAALTALVLAGCSDGGSGLVSLEPGVVTPTPTSVPAASASPAVAAIPAGAAVPIALERSESLWVTGWYAGWRQNQLPPDAIDYEVVTHVAHFMIVPNADGSLQVSNRPGFESPQRIASVVDAVHRAGRQVLVSIGGGGSYEGFSRAIQAPQRATLVDNLVRFVSTHGYDGVDLDMEPIYQRDFANFQSLVRELDAALDALRPARLLTVAAGPSAAICPLANHFDQINVMTYNLSGAWDGWVVWHNSPLFNGGERFPGLQRQLPSIDLRVAEFIAAGCPARRLAIAMDFYAHVWTGGDGTDSGGATRPRQRWTTPPRR